MGWERRTKKPHICKLPDAWHAQRKHAAVGDIWKCRKCGTRWELTHKGIPSKGRAGTMHKNSWRKLTARISPGTPRRPAPLPCNPEPMISAPSKRPPPDTSWIRTQTVCGSGKTSGPDPIEPSRQTGTDWLYSEREGRA